MTLICKPCGRGNHRTRAFTVVMASDVRPGMRIAFGGRFWRVIEVRP